MKKQNLRKAAMQIAHDIYKINPSITWSECQRQGWAAAKARKAMNDGEVTLTFKKQDGEIRIAKGTTNLAMFNLPAPKATTDNKPGAVIKFYEIGTGWRSFRADRLISVAA